MTQRRDGWRQTWPWFPALFASSQPWAASCLLSPHIPAKTGPFFAPINVFGLNWYNFIVTQHDRIMSHWLVSAFYVDLEQAYSCLDPLICQHQFIVQKDINFLAVCAWNSLNKKYCKYLLYFYIDTFGHEHFVSCKANKEKWQILKKIAWGKLHWADTWYLGVEREASWRARPQIREEIEEWESGADETARWAGHNYYKWVRDKAAQ